MIKRRETDRSGIRRAARLINRKCPDRTICVRQRETLSFWDDRADTGPTAPTQQFSAEFFNEFVFDEIYFWRI